jgi:hypothetical protein
MLIKEFDIDAGCNVGQWFSQMSAAFEKHLFHRLNLTENNFSAVLIPNHSFQLLFHIVLE